MKDYTKYLLLWDEWLKDKKYNNYRLVLHNIDSIINYDKKIQKLYKYLEIYEKKKQSLIDYIDKDINIIFSIFYNLLDYLDQVEIMNSPNISYKDNIILAQIYKFRIENIIFENINEKDYYVDKLVIIKLVDEFIKLVKANNIIFLWDLISYLGCIREKYVSSVIINSRFGTLEIDNTEDFKKSLKTKFMNIKDESGISIFNEDFINKLL